MRITGGVYKGRRLKSPKSNFLRPTSDKVREALFSSLGDDIRGAVVADLFCGTGALGIEALSRGAKFVFFVDNSEKAIILLRENINSLEIQNQVKIIKKDALKVPENVIDDSNIIFADPPYRKGYCGRLLSLLSLPKFDWRGIIMLEYESEDDPQNENFSLLKRLNFGDTSVNFMIKRKGGGDNSP